MMLNSQASMADIHSEKGETRQAIQFYEQTIGKRRDKANLCDDYNNLGQLYSESKMYLKSIDCFKKSIYLSKNLKDSFRLSRGYYNYSLVQLELQNFDSSLYYLNQSYNNDEYSSIPGNKITYLQTQARLYYDNGDDDMAQKLYDSSLIYSLKTKLKNERLYVLQGLSSLLERKQQLSEANKILHWQISLSDSLFSENIQNSIANLEVKYNTERKTTENIHLSKENKSQRVLLFVFGSCLVLLMLASFFIYKNQQNKRKKTLAETNLNINKILEEVNQTKMEAWQDGQEKERSRLAAELHDRLGGLLVMASHHFTGIEKKFDDIKKENEAAFSDFRMIINNAIIEVRELSKDISSNLVSKLGLPNAMLDLKEKIENATGLKVELNIHNAEAKVALTKEIGLFRIAQEALNNIMKHANATTVQLSLTGNENSLVLMIEDNGKGFEMSKNIDLAGMGLKSMEKRMTDIGGTLNIDSKVGRGTIVVAEVGLDV